MYSPMMGGAEAHLKDIIFNLDRSRYEVTLFYEPWSDFDEFLELASCPDLAICPVKVVELSGHFGARTETPAGVRGGATGLAALLDRLRAIKNNYLPPGFGRVWPTFSRCLRYTLMPLNLWRLTSAFRKHPVDLLHIINGGYPAATSAQLGPIAARLAAYPHCVMTVCNTPEPVLFPRLLERLLDAAVRRNTNRILVSSDELGRLMVKDRGFAAAQVIKLPYGVVDAPSRPPKPSQSRAAHSPCIGMVASFLSNKGHKHLIEATAILLPKFPELRVELVGDGPERAVLIAQIARLGLKDRVFCTGFRPLKETLELMRGWDVFVLSSEQEGLPYVILHAMSLAKPVVSTAVGSIPEVIIQGKTGYVVPPSDVPALVQAIGFLLSDPEHAARLGAAGRLRYEENFTVMKMVARYEALYDSLVTNLPPRRVGFGKIQS